MKILLGKTAGSCFGVKNAIEKAQEKLTKHNKIYCLGELVHNDEVTKDLEGKGMIFINQIEEAKEKVIIRAHGEPEETYRKAEKQGLEVIDLTCPKVAKIHNIVKEYTSKDYYIFITGKANHPEVIGIIGFANNNYSIIEDLSDIEDSIQKFTISKYTKALLISQTTFSLEKFEKIKDKIINSIGKENVEVINTICTATRLRQDETLEISQKVDAMIIIGGKHSSNTAKLYEIASKNCPTYFIEKPEEIEKDKIRGYNTIGVMAGASTPDKSIKKVIDILEKI